MSTTISRLYNWVTDKTNSVKITASKHDAEADQVIVALNRKVLCSGSAPGSPIAGQTWVDTTNKYLKVYRNNEWVIITMVHVGTAAPATVQEGDLWYDSTNNLLKTYNGSTWDAVPAHPASTASQDLLYYSAANQLARLAASTAGYILRTGGTAIGTSPSLVSPGACFATSNSSADTTTATGVPGDALISVANIITDAEQSVALTFSCRHTFSGAGVLIKYQFYRGTSALGQEIADRAASGDPYAFSMQWIDLKPGLGTSTYSVRWRGSTGTQTCTEKMMTVKVARDVA